MKTIEEILTEQAEQGKRWKKREMKSPFPKEIGTYPCWATQINYDIWEYAKKPAAAEDGGLPLTFWEAHLEHWRYRILENLLCDQLVVRPNDVCDSCHRIVIAWEREYYARRKLRRAQEQT